MGETGAFVMPGAQGTQDVLFTHRPPESTGGVLPLLVGAAATSFNPARIALQYSHTARPYRSHRVNRAAQIVNRSRNVQSIPLPPYSQNPCTIMP